MISDHVRNARDASKCARRRVGAVVVIGGAVVATGHNHIPLGRGDGRACDEGGCPRGALSYDEQAAYVDYGNCHATHAEVAACEGYTAAWGRPVPAGAVVVVSCRPCDGCAAYLSGLGVSWEVVTAVVVCLSVAVWDYVRVLPPTPDCATIGAHQGEVGAT